MSASGVRRLVAAGGVAVVLAACSSGPVSWPPQRTFVEQPVQELGWTQVPVGGAVRAIAGLDSAAPPPHLLAVGDDGGRPLLVDVTDGRAHELPPPAQGRSWTPPDGGYQLVTATAT